MESEHDQLIRKVANWLHKNHYNNLLVDHIRWEPNNRPEGIRWKNKPQSKRIPDISADGLIVEVETCETLTDQDTKDQCELFNAYAKQHNKQFWLVAPDQCSQKVYEVAKRWGLQNTKTYTSRNFD